MKIKYVLPKLLSLWDAGPIRGKRKAVLLIGKPGIGKTTVAEEFAKKLAKKLGRTYVNYRNDIAEEIIANRDKYLPLIDFRLTEIEPTDITGMLKEKNGYSRYIPFLWSIVASTGPSVLLLDEFLNIQRLDVKSVSYKLVHDRKAGWTTFHPDTFIIATGNLPEESSVSGELPPPLLDRFIKIEVDGANPDEWAKWMDKTFGDGWSKSVYAFLKRFETEHYINKTPSEPETLEQFPTQRSWTDLAVLESRGVVDDHLIKGLVGQEIGVRYSAWKRVKVDVNELINHPEKWNDLNFDSKYMATLMLASYIAKRMKKGKMGQVFPLIDVMARDSIEFVVITFTSIPKKKRISFAMKLFEYNREYGDKLMEILELKNSIL